MVYKLKMMIACFILMLLTACSTIVQKLDASGWKEKTVYQKAEALPPLEVEPNLVSRSESPTL